MDSGTSKVVETTSCEEKLSGESSVQSVFMFLRVISVFAVKRKKSMFDSDVPPGW